MSNNVVYNQQFTWFVHYSIMADGLYMDAI
jgi:hypothetical protein